MSLVLKVRRRLEGLGTSSRAIAAGHRATVTVHLNHAGLQLLGKTRRLTVTLSIAEKGAKTVTRTVTFHKRG